MAEDTPYIPPGAEDEEDDILGKLDDLLNKHRAHLQDPDPVPMLTDALDEEDTTESHIPTLTDIVAGPSSPRPGNAPTRTSLEAALVQRLAMRLEAERARLQADAGGDPVIVQVLDELVESLRQALPDIVRMALSRQERRLVPRPDDGSR